MLEKFACEINATYTSPSAAEPNAYCVVFNCKKCGIIRAERSQGTVNEIVKFGADIRGNYCRKLKDTPRPQ